MDDNSVVTTYFVRLKDRKVSSFNAVVQAEDVFVLDEGDEVESPLKLEVDFSLCIHWCHQLTELK